MSLVVVIYPYFSCNIKLHKGKLKSSYNQTAITHNRLEIVCFSLMSVKLIREAEPQYGSHFLLSG